MTTKDFNMKGFCVGLNSTGADGGLVFANYGNVPLTHT